MTSITFETGLVTVAAGPGPGMATATSSGMSQSIGLLNALAAPQVVPITGDYSFGLLATALPGESAMASAGFRIVDSAGTPLFAFAGAVSAPPNSDQTGALVPFNFNLTIPANAVTAIRIDPFATATAVGVPEPPSLVLSSIGAFVLFCYGWCRRRQVT
jgi:hypothetical protein